MKNLIAVVAVLGFGVVAVVVLAQNASKPNPDDEKLQGTWRVVAAEAEGMQVPAAKLQALRISFVKGRFTFKEDGSAENHEYKLDSAKTPKQVDLIQRKEVLFKDSKKSIRVETRKGIFEVNGDDLKLCYNNDEDEGRPTEFKSKAGTQILFLQLKRQK